MSRPLPRPDALDFKSANKRGNDGVESMGKTTRSSPAIALWRHEDGTCDVMRAMMVAMDSSRELELLTLFSSYTVERKAITHKRSRREENNTKEHKKRKKQKKKTWVKETVKL